MPIFVRMSSIALVLLLACGDDSSPSGLDGLGSGSSSTAGATDDTTDESTGESTDASTEESSSTADPSASSEGASSSTDEASSSDTSSTGAAACGGADEALVLAAFVACEQLPGHLGQIADATGVTCEQACCVLGFAGCVHRAAQIGLDGCADRIPMQTGECTDVFEQGWSSHCLCE